jgi:hypothetical protein
MTPRLAPNGRSSGGAAKLFPWISASGRDAATTATEETADGKDGLKIHLRSWMPYGARRTVLFFCAVFALDLHLP